LSPNGNTPLRHTSVREANSNGVERHQPQLSQVIIDNQTGITHGRGTEAVHDVIANRHHAVGHLRAVWQQLPERNNVRACHEPPCGYELLQHRPCKLSKDRRTRTRTKGLWERTRQNLSTRRFCRSDGNHGRCVPNKKKPTSAHDNGNQTQLVMTNIIAVLSRSASLNASFALNRDN